MAGRGIEWYYIAELMFYWSAAVLPMSMPIAILLSSIMTFGGLAEHYELASMKSAGVSLIRIMRPLIVLMIFIAIGMFFVSNNLIPVANFKGENLLVNIAKQKPAFNLSPGVFYNGIEGFSIKVGEKNESELKDVIIYDHSKRNQGNIKVTIAKAGKMELIDNESYLEFTLYDGWNYEEMLPSKSSDRQKMPFVKSHFDKSVVRFSMASFQQGDLSKTNRSKDFDMMNINQLIEGVDSMYTVFNERRNEMVGIYQNRFNFKRALSSGDTVDISVIKPQVIENLPQAFKMRTVQNALRTARSYKSNLEELSGEYNWRYKVIARHYIVWHRKFAVSIACIILFFIGAPFGAIIRKGGMGMPLVVSVIIFLIYHVLTIIFEKMGRELVWGPVISVWLPAIILLPAGIYLTYKAANDSSILDASTYMKPLRWLNNFFRKKNRQDETTGTVQ